MTEELNELIKRAKRIKMTDEQKTKQRNSFAYWNVKIENDFITEDMLKRAELKIIKERKYDG